MSTQQPGLIFGLIPKIMKDVGAIGKDRKNEQQGYKFRGIEDMYNAIHPALITHGVFCAPNVTKSTSTDRITAAGKPSIRVELEVCHRFYASDGSFVDVTTVGEGIDSSDKASNKAMSAAMKYAYIELLAIPTADMSDGDRDDPDAGHKNGNGKPVPVIEKDIELAPKPAAEFITVGQQKNIHTEFRKAVRKEFAGDIDIVFYEFLTVNKFVDDQGVPTAARIPAGEWFAIKEKALAKARSL
jgi:hypothetical protein